ncbi:hypothetical protein ACJ73_09815 [Blastomyces percursus]|uniref:C2H2-type domain-containing protein n=1 Tax=Blastomyces percursus TaxID=1658174 RepID=A0A1J9P3E0_9EURO|nr:hypothetical protein ACJ73_09815 [Blastomyces percursus]
MCPYSDCDRSSGEGFTRKANLEVHIRHLHRGEDDRPGESLRAKIARLQREAMQRDSRLDKLEMELKQLRQLIQTGKTLASHLLLLFGSLPVWSSKREFQEMDSTKPTIAHQKCEHGDQKTTSAEANKLYLLAETFPDRSCVNMMEWRMENKPWLHLVCGLFCCLLLNTNLGNVALRFAAELVKEKENHLVSKT